MTCCHVFFDRFSKKINERFYAIFGIQLQCLDSVINTMRIMIVLQLSEFQCVVEQI